MRGEEAAVATSDLPPSQNSRPKAAGGCQATLSLSQQEAESHTKKSIHHSAAPSHEKFQCCTSCGRTARFQSHQLALVIYQQSHSQQCDITAAGLQPAGVFAQLMKNTSEVVLFLGCSLLPAYLNSLRNIYIFLKYYFHAGKDLCRLCAWRIYLAANFLKNKS